MTKWRIYRDRIFERTERCNSNLIISKPTMMAFDRLNPHELFARLLGTRSTMCLRNLVIGLWGGEFPIFFPLWVYKGM